MDIKTINTPEQLHQAIGKFLQSDYSHENLVETYNDARKCAIRFRGDYSALPAVPAFKDNPLDGLQDVMDWCIKSSEVVDDIVFNLERQTISATIRQLKKLKDSVNRALSLVDSELKEQAQKEASAKVENEYKNLSDKLSRLQNDKMPLISQAEVLGELQLEHNKLLRRVTEDIVQIYLSKDPTLKDKLSQLHDEEINKTLVALVGSDTPTGKLLDIYCKLKDIPLQRQFDNVRYTYFINDYTDLICGGCNRLYTSIDTVIKTFEEIQTKVEQGKGTMENIQSTSEPTKDAIRDQVFICYSHKDERWLNDLQTHLKPYVRNGLTAWSDEQIAPGSKWIAEIEAALASAKVVVLLVTQDLLASDFIHAKELGPLLKKAKKGKVRIIWIPVRACAYKETLLKDYQAAGDPEKPLEIMKANRNTAWVKICEEIKKAVLAK